MTTEKKPETALARREEHHIARPAMPDLDAVEFGRLIKVGDELVKTGFMPRHIRTGAQAAAIIQTGRELGMTAMRALRSLHMVEGKVVEDAASQLARFKSAGGRAAFKTLDEKRAVLALRHPNGDEHTETFTVDDAKAAGLAGKDNWRKHGKAMLRSRVITAGLKSVGWEGSVGMYGEGELEADDGSWMPSTEEQERAVRAVPRSAPPAREEHVEGEVVEEPSRPSRPATSTTSGPASSGGARAKSSTTTKKSATDLICDFLDRVDDAQDDEERLKAIEGEWLDIETSIRSEDARLGVGTYISVTIAGTHGLSPTLTAEESAAMAKVANLRKTRDRVSTPPTSVDDPEASRPSDDASSDV